MDSPMKKERETCPAVGHDGLFKKNDAQWFALKLYITVRLLIVRSA